MNDYQTIKLSPEFVIEIDPTWKKYSLSDEVLEEIEKIWEEEKKDIPGLFNGKIMTVTQFNKDRVIGQFVDYKHFLAQKRNPSLKQYLQIQALAITGVTMAQGHVLIGKRSNQVAHYRGLYELTPSGGIDPDAYVGHYIDFREQLQRELEEETGYKKDVIKKMEPLYLMVEPNCVEIIATAELELTDLTVKATHEYEELMWILREHLRSFVDKHEKHMVPLSVFFIRKLF